MQIVVKRIRCSVSKAREVISLSSTKATGIHKAPSIVERNAECDWLSFFSSV